MAPAKQKRSKSSTRRNTPTRAPGDIGGAITLESTDTWLTGAQEPKIMKQERGKYPSTVELCLALGMFLGTATIMFNFTVFAILDSFIFLFVPTVCYAVSMVTVVGPMYGSQVEVILDVARNGTSNILAPFWKSEEGSSARLTMAYLLFCYAFFVWHVKYRGNRAMKVLYALLFAAWSFSCCSLTTSSFEAAEKTFLMVSSVSGVAVAIGHFFEPQLTEAYFPKAMCAPTIV